MLDMTAFVDCLKSALDAGSMRRDKYDEAVRAYNDEIANGVAKGLTPEQAADAATVSSVDSMGKYTAAQKWRKINEIRRYHELYTTIGGSKNITRTMERLAEDLDTVYTRETGKAMSFMAGMIDKYRPRYAGIIHPVKDMDNVAREAYGQNTNDLGAKGYAVEIADTLEYMRQSANAKGASIPPNPNKRLPQQHDWLKIRRAKDGEWVNDHMADGVLDWTLMEYNGKPIALADRRALLQRTYESIISKGNSRIVPGEGHSAGNDFLGRMGRERFLYYDNADAYLKMQDKYGSGNTHQQLIASIDTMSRDIAQLEVLSANPYEAVKFVQETAKMWAGARDKVDPGKRVSNAKTVAEANDVFLKSFDLFTHAGLNGEENVMAQGMATIRTAVNTALLHGVFIANLGDVGFMKFGAMAEHTPMGGIVREVWKNFGMDAEGRMHAIRSGLLAESATSMAMSYMRFFGTLQGASWAKRLSDTSMRAGLMTPWTQATRWAHGKHFMGAMADAVNIEFKDLPWRETWEKEGITAEDWDMLRKTPINNFKGATFLRPMDLANAPAGDRALNNRVADKFLDYMHRSSKTAVPQVNLRTRVAMGENIPATSVVGQMTRTALTMKSFGAFVLLNHVRGIMQQQSIGAKIGHGAALFSIMTIMGALVTQVKDVVAGKDPENIIPWQNPLFWVKAAVNGGSMGMLGDLVYNSITGGFSSAMGPAVDWAKATANLSKDAVLATTDMVGLTNTHTSVGKDATAYVARYTPNIWMLKLVTQRMIFDNMLKMADPAAFAKIQKLARKQERDTGQGYWWAPGDSRPKRGPNFGNIIGMKP